MPGGPGSFRQAGERAPPRWSRAVVNRSFALDAAALALLAAIALIVLVLIGHVRAEPMPVPKTDQCSSGYASEACVLRAHAPGPVACSASHLDLQRGDALTLPHMLQ